MGQESVASVQSRGRRQKTLGDERRFLAPTVTLNDDPVGGWQSSHMVTWTIRTRVK